MNRLSSRTADFRLAPVAIALLLALYPTMGTLANKPNSFPDIAVTSTLNTTGSITPDPGTNYRIENDGNGQYFDGSVRSRLSCRAA
jgi:hypothetical protein